MLTCNKDFKKNKTVALRAIIFIFAVGVTASADTQTDTPTLSKENIGVPGLTPQDLMKRLYRAEAVMIVDVRSSGEYNARHIIGAQSIPLGEIESRIEEFPVNRDIVFY